LAGRFAIPDCRAIGVTQGGKTLILTEAQQEFLPPQASIARFLVPETNEIGHLEKNNPLIPKVLDFSFSSYMFLAYLGECQIDKVRQKLSSCEKQTIDTD